MWCGIMFLIVIVLGDMEYYFSVEPSDNTVLRGDRVVLPCRLNYKTRVQWTKDGFGLGQERQLPGFPTMRMIGRDLGRDWDLEIFPAKLDDEAVYQCQVLDRQKIRSRLAQLVVISQPLPPTLTPSGDSLVVLEDIQTHVTCHTRAGKPAPQLQWETDNVVVEKVIPVVEKELVGELGGTFNSKSSIYFTPQRKNEGTRIICIVGDQMISTVLSVQYRPIVVVKLSSSGHLREGDTVVAECTVTAKPSITNTVWNLDGQIITMESNKLYVERSMDQQRLGCLASNRIGSGVGDILLEVIYSPVITTQPKSLLSRQGERVSFYCQADSNPASSYRWYRKENKNKLLGDGDTLYITVKESSEDCYFCQAELLDFPVVNSECASITIRSIPQIVSDLIQYGKRLTDVHILCQGKTSKDVAVTILWSLSHVPITNGTKYVIDNQRLKGDFKSILTVRNASLEDFSIYTCRVENEVGSVELSISVVDGEVAGQLQTLRIVLGLFGGLTSLLVIGVAVWFCRNLDSCVRSTLEEDGQITRSEEISEVTTSLMKEEKTSCTRPLDETDPETSFSGSPTSILSRIPSDYAAYYGNPHLSTLASSDDEDDDDLDQIRMAPYQTYTRPHQEYAAFYGNPKLSTSVKELELTIENTSNIDNVRDEQGIMKTDKEFVVKHKSVNFNPETQVMNVPDTNNEDGFHSVVSDESVYSDDVYEYGENVFIPHVNVLSEDDEEDIITLPESKFMCHKK